MFKQERSGLQMTDFEAIELYFEMQKHLSEGGYLQKPATSTGEVIHSCGFIHGDFEPCRSKKLTGPVSLLSEDALSD